MPDIQRIDGEMLKDGSVPNSKLEQPPGDMSTAVYDPDEDGSVAMADVAALAQSVDWDDVTNKPSITTDDAWKKLTPTSIADGQFADFILGQATGSTGLSQVIIQYGAQRSTNEWERGELSVVGDGSNYEIIAGDFHYKSWPDAGKEDAGLTFQVLVASNNLVLRVQTDTRSKATKITVRYLPFNRF